MKQRKIFWQFILFAAVLALTLCMVFGNKDMERILTAVGSMDSGYLAAAVFLACFFTSAEGCMIWYLLKNTGGKGSLCRCIAWSFAGFFFSGITPSASGGQPVQLLFMKRRGNCLADSSVVLMTVAVAYKLVLVLIGLFLLVFWNSSLHGFLGGYYYLYLLGWLLNLGVVAILAAVMLKPGTMQKVVCTFEAFFTEHKWLKPSGSRRKKIEVFLAQYQDTVHFLCLHKGLMWKIMAGTFLQRSSVFLLTWIVYLGLGLTEPVMWKVIFLQAAVYIAVDMLPVPGAQGITEAMYQTVFRPFFKGDALIASLCISRGISFYMLLAVGFFMFLMLQFLDHEAWRGCRQKIGNKGENVKVGNLI